MTDETRRRGIACPMRDQYLTRAAEFYVRARFESDETTRRQFEVLEKTYLRLAKQANNNKPPEGTLRDRQ
jgi:hypothetical protein